MTESQGGQEDDGVMSTKSLMSSLGSPHIAAGWGYLPAGASCSSNVGHSLEAQFEDASSTEDAASSADAGSVADETTTADGGDGGVKEGGWEEVKWPARKGKAKLLRSKYKQGSRSNAGLNGNRGKSRLGNAHIVLEVPRPSGNAGKSRLGNASTCWRSLGLWQNECATGNRKFVAMGVLSHNPALLLNADRCFDRIVITDKSLSFVSILLSTWAPV